MKGKFTLTYPKRFEAFLQNALKLGVAAILLAVPLYPKFPLFNIPGTRVAIRLEDFLILIVSIIWFVLVLPNIKTFVKKPLTQAVLLFWAVGLFSVFAAIFLSHTVSPSIAILNWGRRIQYMICLFIGIDAVRKKEDLPFYIKCILVDIVYVFIVGLGQVLLHWPVITTQNDEYSKGLALFYMKGGHLASTFAGHYDMAAFLLTVLPIVATLIFVKKDYIKELFGKSNVLFGRGLLAVITIFGVWLLTQAASRISVVSYFVVIGIAFVLNKRFKALPIVIAVSLAIVVMSGGSLESRYLNLIDVIYKKVISVEIIPTTFAKAVSIPASSPEVLVTPSPSPTPVPIVEDRSTNIRLAVEWPRAIRALTKNPLLGTGYSSITLATDNDYLRMLGEVGVFGFLSFSLVFLRIIIDLFGVFMIRKNGIEKIYIYAILAGLVGLAINLVFIDLLEASKYAITMWLLIGFAIAAKKLLKDEN